MTLEEEIERLRLRITQLAAEAEADPVLKRYPPLFGRLRLSLYRRTRLAVGDVLRRLGLRAKPEPRPWHAGLRHAAGTEHAAPLVLWALGAEREALRQACLAFKQIEDTLLPAHIPVLVTDTADFAFFSRLGWLIEYVPALSAPAADYAARKTRYLAWRYRDAPVFPVSAGLSVDFSAERIRDLIALRHDPAPAEDTIGTTP